MKKYLSRKFLLGVVLMICLVVLQLLGKLSQELLAGFIGVYSIYVTGNVYQSKNEADKSEGV